MYMAYYMNQAGGDLPDFIGASTQYSHGLGGIFRNLFRLAVLLLKRGFSLAKPHLKTAATNIMADAVSSIARSTASGKQEGNGVVVIKERQSDPHWGITSRHLKSVKTTRKNAAVPKRSQQPKLAELRTDAQAILTKTYSKAEILWKRETCRSFHNQSKECVKTELDLFTVPYTQTSIEKSKFVEIPPVSAITDTGPLEFFISESSEDYLDLNDTYLFTRVRITNADGTNLANGADVGFLNYPGCTFFSQVEVMLGDRLISQSSNTYPYRGIIECLFNYGKDTLDTQFSTGLFCKDSSHNMDETSITGKTNMVCLNSIPWNEFKC